MTQEHIDEYKARVNALLDDTPILCDWSSMDLRYLAERNNDAKQPPMGPLHEEEADDINVYNIGDYVLIQSDKTLTPNQRFWVGQVMNTTRRHTIPDINADDPPPEDDAIRWFKVWWCSSNKEFGVYTKEFICPNGVRSRSMSWEEEVRVICKLKGGLNKKGTIKSYRCTRRQIDYDVKQIWGDLVGEDLDYLRLTDTVTRDIAESLVGKFVSRYDEESEEQESGVITSFVTPPDDDNDRRIHFNVVFEGGERDIFNHSELTQMIQ